MAAAEATGDTEDTPRCVECDMLPVKSRRNMICLTCDAVVCTACQGIHFEHHEP